MALDEALLRGAAARGRPLLRVYAWAQPAASFGYFQKFPAHLAGTYAVVRRPTGGGVVYHGDDTTYTVIAPPAHPLATMKTAAAYETLHRAVAAALALGPSPSCARGSDPAPTCDRRSPAVERRPAVVQSARSGDRRTAPDPAPAGAPSLHSAPLASPSGQYECFQRPVRGDVVQAGRKLAGGAQRRTKWGLLHQGSIATTLTVAQLTAGFARTLGVTFAPFQVGAAAEQLTAQLVTEKYTTAAWNNRVT